MAERDLSHVQNAFNRRIYSQFYRTANAFDSVTCFDKTVQHILFLIDRKYAHFPPEPICMCPSRALNITLLKFQCSLDSTGEWEVHIWQFCYGLWTLTRICIKVRTVYSLPCRMLRTNRTRGIQCVKIDLWKNRLSSFRYVKLMWKHL